jgi:two-component system, chemotaxis family, protein-glutamate methylesterase/glutaminase
VLNEADAQRVVVIGASAGGVEALGEILPRLAGELSIIAVVHLPPERPSLLTTIFSPRCSLEVKEAEDKEPISLGTIYFAPPDYHLLIEKNLHLALALDEPVHHSRPSIDVLFYSAIDALGVNAKAVLLTGANRDGAAGLAAIHAAGGMTIVQHPAHALAPEMPSAALSMCRPTHVLPLDAIGDLLGQFVPPRRDAR